MLALIGYVESVGNGAIEFALERARLGSVAVVDECHERVRTFARNEFWGFWGRNHLQYPRTSRNRKGRVGEMEDAAARE